MTSILIVGGAGYLGSALTEEFLKAGHQVTVLDILRRGSDGIIQHKDNPNFTFVNADFMTYIMDYHVCQNAIVIHLAAIVGDPACAAEPELATQTNVEGVKMVVSACNEYNKPLFFASTASIYGSNIETCNELTLPKPLSHYARTKLEAENYIWNHSKTGLIFRFGTLHGQSPNMRYDLIINRLVRDAVKNKSFQIFDGTQFRPFLHPRDIAHFFCSLFKKDLHNFIGQTFNLVAENLSMDQLGMLVHQLIPSSQMIKRPDKEDDRTYICSCFKAYSMLGFNPKMRVYQSIQEMERYLIQ